MNETTLAELAPGESGRIVKIEGRGILAQRLVDMGLYPGVAAKVVRRAPSATRSRWTPKARWSICAAKKRVS